MTQPQIDPVPIKLDNSVYPPDQNHTPDPELQRIFNENIKPLRDTMRLTTNAAVAGDREQATANIIAWLESGYLADFDAMNPTDNDDRLAASALTRFMAHVRRMQKLYALQIPWALQTNHEGKILAWKDAKKQADSGYYKGNHGLFAAYATGSNPWFIIQPNGVAPSEIRGVSTWRYHMLASQVLALICEEQPRFCHYYESLFKLMAVSWDADGFAVMEYDDMDAPSVKMWWHYPILRKLGLPVPDVYPYDAPDVHSWFGLAA